MAAWLDELISAAVLGTDRRPPPSPPSDIAATARPVSETAILDQAAIAASLVRAGRRPTTAAPTGLAPVESLPLAPARAVELLGVLLDAPPVSRDLRVGLLLRWLDAAADHGTLVPPRYLPQLIATSGVQPRLLPSLQRAWGRRGDWLTQIASSGVSRPVRRDAAALDAEWDRLRTVDAVAALEELRGSDPDGARRIAAARWSTLPADLAQRVLDSWATGLSDADEDFLEAALDARSSRVRESARMLLRRLPTSGFAERMGNRLRPLVTVDRARLRPSHTRVAVLAPAELDRDAARDGLPGTASAADRTRSLQMILTSAPLAVWPAATGLSAEQTVRAVREDATLLSALVTAATSQRDQVWVRAPLAVRNDGALIAALPRTERDDYLVRRIPAENDAGFRDLSGLLDPPWSPAVARAVLQRVTRRAPEGAAKRPVRSPTLDAASFPAESIPFIRELLARAELPGADVVVDESLRRVLSAAVTYSSFDQSIQEAFT